jgi:hypothetical protein
MNVNNGAGRNSNRGFTVMGKVVAIVAVDDERFAMEVEPIKGTMKGEKILISLDPDVAANNSKFSRPEITDKGIKYPNGYAGVGAVMAFEGATFTSDKDADQRTMNARWPLKMNDNTVVLDDISIAHFSGGNLRALHPSKGVVIAADGEAKESLDTAIRQTIASASEDEMFVFIFRNDNDVTDVDIIYLQTRDDSGTYGPSSAEAIDGQIEKKLASFANLKGAVVVPGGFINKSEYVNDAKLRVGITPVGVPVTQVQDEKDATRVYTRVEGSGLAAMGLVGRQDNPPAMSDNHIFGRIKGQVESFGPDQTDQARDSVGSTEEDIDLDNPFEGMDAAQQEESNAPR